MEEIINENRQSKNADIPKFITYGVPQGKKGMVKIVRTDKELDILKNHVSYEFASTVTDTAVMLWVLCLKIYNDNNYNKIKDFQGTDLVASMLADTHTAIFDIGELSKRIFGKRVKASRILQHLENVANIKINIVRDGRKAGFTRFSDSVYLHKDKKHIQFNFNSFMLFIMAQDFRLLNIDKYVSLTGSASRIYLVMQGWKRYRGNKAEYVKISHSDLCDAMGVDIKHTNTIANLTKDFKDAGINFMYHRFEKYWYYPNKKLDI